MGLTASYLHFEPTARAHPDRTDDPVSSGKCSLTERGTRRPIRSLLVRTSRRHPLAVPPHGAADNKVLQLQRLGTRAVIAETFVAQAVSVQKAVTLLCEAAASGDLAAAKALVLYLDQALGKPTERHELRVPSSVEEVEQLSDAELERIVAQGRAKRLALRPAPGPTEGWRRRGPPLGVVDGDVVADD